MNRPARWSAFAAGMVIVLLAAEWSMARPPSWLWRAQASEEMCTVYRAVFEDLRRNGAPIFWSGTVAWRPMIHEDASDLNGYAPDVFKRRHQGDATAQPADFVADTSAYFAPLRAEPSLFIRNCFAGREGPSFHFGPGGFLVAAARGNAARFWRLSPVGFSADGRRALVYAEKLCGSLCGVGFYYLFEKRAGAWTLEGTSVAWIS